MIGSERLFLVCLRKPAHNSSQQHHQQQRGKDTITDPLPMYRGHSYSHSPLIELRGAVSGALRGSQGGHSPGSGGGGAVTGAAAGGAEGGGFAFRLEAQSHLQHAEMELLDATGTRLHELHRLRRAGMVVRASDGL